MRSLILKGVRQNNLKDISLELPLGQSIVITGPSGSGKSSLAFETIYAEGQRRYMQSLSTYARQFLEKFKAPDVDGIHNIPPTVALEQINPVRNARATVGTTTEIYDYLRILFEKAGVEYCDSCHLPMQRRSVEEAVESLSHTPADVVMVGAPQDARDIPKLIQSGFSRGLLDGEIVPSEDFVSRGFQGPLTVLIDRIKWISPLSSELFIRTRESIQTALNMGRGTANIYAYQGGKLQQKEELTSEKRCPKCHKLSAVRSATAFSFNSPLGACSTCKGFGNTLQIDEDLIVPNRALSIARGAIEPFTKPSLRKWQRVLLDYCKRMRMDADLPYHELPEKHRKLIFEGDGSFKGVRGVFDRLQEKKYKLRVRVFLSRYTSAFVCETCRGTRLNSEALKIRVGNKNIAELSDLTLSELEKFIHTLSEESSQAVFGDLFHHILRRLNHLNTVGLGYLTLSRLTRSLSGGEYQRILLGTQLSQGLTETLYVLDEPSIGLHPKDTGRLLKVLENLKEMGNSLIVVEHDPDVIGWGDYIVDMGPGSGRKGGEVTFHGSRDRFLVSNTQTAEAVREWKQDCRSSLLAPTRPCAQGYLELKGARGNNLKNIDIQIPLRRLVVITGVSGSGKSTLIADTLYPALSKIFGGRSAPMARFESLSGFENLSAVELVDQSPIGKSSRSNPITFIKGFDEIRSLFAHSPVAASQHLTPGHFSFNVSGGRCDKCQGEGRLSIDMVFLEDVWIPCDQCNETRFKPFILKIRFRGKNINEVLQMTIDEASDFFQGVSSLRSKLGILKEVGLGYLTLGQPADSLSGGEAQRLKIARELITVSSRRAPTLFIFDEPTTGLHFHEVKKLLGVLRRLIAGGHSVIVIEHNVQVICASDFIIDLGPDGGIQGGYVVASGTPKELADKKLPYTGQYLAEFLN